MHGKQAIPLSSLLTTSNWSWRCNDIIITVFLIWLRYLWLRCYILDFLLLFHSTAQGQDPMVQCSIQLPGIFRACLHFLIFRNKKKVHRIITEHCWHSTHQSCHISQYTFQFSHKVFFKPVTMGCGTHSGILDIQNSSGESIFLCLVPTFSG